MKNKGATTHRFVRLTLGMMETKAWQSLDGNARAIYVALATIYCGSNNGRIGCSVRQAARTVSVSPATAARSMTRLQERGFIVAMTKGYFKLKRHATEWRLTEFRCDVTGQPASRDFESWTSADILPLHPREDSAEKGTDG